ncbi:CDP-alcohol phosphatidyltransferase family protein [bacterium]|nr:MAG: CDP-alcohol phosphatidyltransferase family protein [bacterium]
MKAAWLKDPALVSERVGGLKVLERQLFLLRRAGFERAWVSAPRPDEDLRLPEGLDVSWGAGPDGEPRLEVSGRHLVRLAALKEAAAGGPARWRDEAGETVLAVVGSGAAAERPLPPGASVPLSAPLRGGPVDSWLMREAVKGTDGFMAKHFDRRISLAVTRLLLDTPVTPNQMTVASTAVGLAGAALLAAGAYGPGLAGALLVWLHSTLDGCDGELARLRFQESPLGGVLDFWGDNLVHAALFLCLGAGVARAQGVLWPAGLGLLAAASASASAALAYLHSKKKAAARKAAGPFFTGVAEVAPDAAAAERRVASLEDTLAQRDFVYLLVALAAAGRLPWFLWASAVGSPLFLAALLWLRRRSLFV